MLFSNNLQNLREKAFTGLTNLTALFLNNNLLKLMDEKVFKPLPHLKKLLVFNDKAIFVEFIFRYLLGWFIVQNEIQCHFTSILFFLFLHRKRYNFIKNTTLLLTFLNTTIMIKCYFKGNLLYRC